MITRISLLCLLFSFSAANAISQEPAPTIAGYVTDATTPTNFAVNGVHILCNSSTIFGVEANGIINSSTRPSQVYVGEAMKVYGIDKKNIHSILATNVVTPLPQSAPLNGTAVIDLIPPQGDVVKTRPEELLVRADGYLILITPKTHTTFSPPLVSLATITTNTWITYQGKLQPDGTLLAESADFKPNVIPKGENKLRTKSEYDPKAVDPRDKQSGVSKAVLGTKVKKIPPYNDPAMQSRIDSIGAKLVPAYQRNLPASDATKISFRFQLIDEPKWHDAMTLPNGIILVPRQVVERMQNDSQLATVLADNIACAIEKQGYREVPADQKMTAAQIASDAGGFFVPGLSVATTIANHKIAASILRHAEDQSGRISLGFLQDAGYDIYEAPKAWWLLSPGKPKKMTEIHLPERAAYLYSFIGQTWHNLPQGSAAANN